MRAPEQDTCIVAIGDLTVDLIFSSLSSLPAWGQEVECRGFVQRLGGNLGNLAAAAVELGLPITCTGPIGRDPFGISVLTELARLGIAPDHVRVVDGQATSVTAALVREDGERAFITYPGVLRDLAADLLAALELAGDVVFLTGWCQPPRIPVEQLVVALQRFREQGRRIVFDLAWCEDTWARQDDLLAVLALVDDLLMNELELAAITSMTDVERGVDVLRASVDPPPARIVVKRGADGAFGCESSLRIHRPPSHPIAVEHTVGAGDAFNAAYLHASTVRGLAFADAIEYAVTFSGHVLDAQHQEGVRAVGLVHGRLGTHGGQS